MKILDVLFLLLRYIALPISLSVTLLSLSQLQKLHCSPHAAQSLFFPLPFFFFFLLYCSLPRPKIQGFVDWFKFGFRLKFLGFSVVVCWSFLGLWFLGGWIGDGCCWCLFESMARSVMVAIGVCLNRY